MINRAYKHLDSRLRIGELTLGQWTGVFGGVVGAVVYGYFLHPFSTMVTIITAVYLGGLPGSAAILSGFSEFDLWLLLRSAISWRRTAGRYLPGAGASTAGYWLQASAEGRQQWSKPTETLDLASLWGDR